MDAVKSIVNFTLDTRSLAQLPDEVYHYKIINLLDGNWKEEIS